MKGYLVVLLLVLLFLNAFLVNADELKRVASWEFDEVFGYDFFSIVDREHHVVGGFYKVGPRLITPEKIIAFAPRGQGPGDLANFHTAFNYNNDIAVLEYPQKIKIFTKKNGTYVWKETKWLKRGEFPQFVRDGIYFDNKWFFSGFEMHSADKKGGYGATILCVFNNKGAQIKSLIKKKYNKINRHYLMDSHLAGYKSDRVFCLLENELKVYVVSAGKLEIIKEVNLEAPSFYKKMPATTYGYDKEYDLKSVKAQLEGWKSTYSCITEVVVSGDSLVIQVRTSNDELKKFALLFYNAETFKLEKTIFTDDFLLDERDGKFYCFANGNPGRDDDTEMCIINVYTVDKSKSK